MAMPNSSLLRTSRDTFQTSLLEEATTEGRLTVDRCVLACFNGRFTHAALQGGNECLCSNVFTTNDFQRKDDDFCFIRCPGNCRQRCGGHLALSIYKTHYLSIPWNVQQRMESIPLGVLEAGYISCFREYALAYVCSRDVRKKPDLKSVAMTPRMCVLYCSAGDERQKMPIAVTYGRYACCCGKDRQRARNAPHSANHKLCNEKCSGASGLPKPGLESCYGRAYYEGYIRLHVNVYDTVRMEERGLQTVPFTLFDLDNGWVAPVFPPDDKFEVKESVHVYKRERGLHEAYMALQLAQKGHRRRSAEELPPWLNCSDPRIEAIRATTHSQAFDPNDWSLGEEEKESKRQVKEYGADMRPEEKEGGPPNLWSARLNSSGDAGSRPNPMPQVSRKRRRQRKSRATDGSWRADSELSRGERLPRLTLASDRRYPKPAPDMPELMGKKIESSKDTGALMQPPVIDTDNTGVRVVDEMEAPQQGEGGAVMLIALEGALLMGGLAGVLYHKKRKVQLASSAPDSSDLGKPPLALAAKAAGTGRSAISSLHTEKGERVRETNDTSDADSSATQGTTESQQTTPVSTEDESSSPLLKC